MDAGEDDRLAPRAGGSVPGVTGPHDGEAPDVDDRAAARSLLEDIEMLVDDGKTYLEAEVHYQKSRALFVVDEIHSVAIFGAIAGAFGFIALIGLTVGLILALAPWLTTWGSSALVVGVELVVAIILARLAAVRWKRIMTVLASERKDEK